mgnify:CR=1 FL=1
MDRDKGLVADITRSDGFFFLGRGSKGSIHENRFFHL